MVTNVSKTDKAVRVALVLLLAALFYFEIISGIVGLIIVGFLSLTFLLTAVSGYCPLYTLFGYSSCPIKEQEES